MLNSRTLFPALFKPAGGGGGGSGQTIQVAELPEAVLDEKDKIYQYIGSTTETLTNGYFYKCVEHTTTEGDVITVTYSWENISVMEVESGGIVLSETETEVGTYLGKTLFCRVIPKNQLANDALTTDSSYNMLVQNITTIETLVNSILWVKDTNNEVITINGAVKHTTNGGLYWCGYVRSSIGSAGISDKKLIIFYTKTN